jgi:hypothetical protein
MPPALQADESIVHARASCAIRNNLPKLKVEPNSLLNLLSPQHSFMITNTMSREIRPTEEDVNRVLVLKFYQGAREGDPENLVSPDFVGRASGVPQFDRAGFLRAL